MKRSLRDDLACHLPAGIAALRLAPKHAYSVKRFNDERGSSVVNALQTRAGSAGSGVALDSSALLRPLLNGIYMPGGLDRRVPVVIFAAAGPGAADIRVELYSEREGTVNASPPESFDQIVIRIFHLDTVRMSDLDHQRATATAIAAWVQRTVDGLARTGRVRFVLDGEPDRASGAVEPTDPFAQFFSIH